MFVLARHILGPAIPLEPKKSKSVAIESFIPSAKATDIRFSPSDSNWKCERACKGSMQETQKKAKTGTLIAMKTPSASAKKKVKRKHKVTEKASKKSKGASKKALRQLNK